jgi:DNA-binding transcriptional LysR family regulator
VTLEQLRIFVRVAEREHVTRAAHDLNLTQSATSAAIRALEERYRTNLFDRVGRRIVLTDAGRIFLVEARAVLARATAAANLLVDLANLKMGSLIVAASQTVANYWLPSRLARYSERHPAIGIYVTIGNTETVASLIRDGSADVGLVEGIVDEEHLAVSPVADDELVLVVGKSHSWANRSAIAPDEFSNARWVMRERGSGTRAVLETAASNSGCGATTLDVAFELPSNEAVRSAVEAGVGAAILSNLVVHASVLAGTLVRLDCPLPTRKFFVVQHRERHVTRAAAALVAILAEDA